VNTAKAIMDLGARFDELVAADANDPASVEYQEFCEVWHNLRSLLTKRLRNLEARLRVEVNGEVAQEIQNDIKVVKQQLAKVTK
jgi:hypothetical protein